MMGLETRRGDIHEYIFDISEYYEILISRVFAKSVILNTGDNELLDLENSITYNKGFIDALMLNFFEYVKSNLNAPIEAMCNGRMLSDRDDFYHDLTNAVSDTLSEFMLFGGGIPQHMYQTATRIITEVMDTHLLDNMVDVIDNPYLEQIVGVEIESMYNRSSRYIATAFVTVQMCKDTLPLPSW